MSDSPHISVLINTYNRAGMLVRTLQALQRQTGLEELSIEFETIVVDDGSDTSPKDALSQAGLLDFIRFVERPHAGRAAARNAAIKLARGRWIIFLGDDIIADPGLIAAHARLLIADHADARRMYLGYCAWDVKGMSKPLYDFAQAHHFQGLEDGQVLDFRYFYTANVALPRHALDESGLFDESFNGKLVTYGWDDIDLGYRLEQAGWSLAYHPSARAEHIHAAPSIRELYRRQYDIGRSACAFYLKHRTPEAERAAFWPGTREATPGPEWRRNLGCALAWVFERLAPRSKLLETIYLRLVFSARCKAVADGRMVFPDADF